MAFFDEIRKNYSADAKTLVGGVRNVVSMRFGEAVVAGVKDAMRNDDGRIVTGEEVRSSDAYKGMSQKDRRKARQDLKRGVLLDATEFDALFKESGKLRNETRDLDDRSLTTGELVEKRKRLREMEKQKEEFERRQEESEREFKDRDKKKKSGDEKEDEKEDAKKEDGSEEGDDGEDASGGVDFDRKKRNVFSNEILQIMNLLNELQANPGAAPPSGN